MKKTKSKILAVALAVLMTVAVFPITAFAAGTITVALGGVTVSDLGTGDISIDAAKLTPGAVTLTTAQATDADTEIAVTGDFAFKVVNVVAANLADPVALTVVTDQNFGEDLSSVTFADGDALVVYAYDTDEDVETYYVIIVEIDDTEPPTPPASGGGTGRDSASVIGNSIVESVIVNVVVPTTIDYALDPLDIDSVAGQVQAVDLYAVNKTQAPVLVTVDVKATPKSDVTLVDSPSELTPTDMADDVSKDIYFGLLGAKSITPGTLTYSTIPGTAEFTYDEEEAGTLVPFDTDGEASIQFALGAATASALADTNAGVASYTFYAELNTYADWQDGDLDVAADYTFVALKASDVPAASSIAGLNVVKSGTTTPTNPTTPATVGFYTVGETTTVATKTVTTTLPNPALTVPFWFNGATSGAVVTTYNGTAASDTVKGKIIFNYTDNTISVEAGLVTTAARTFVFTLGGTSYTCTISN